MPFLNSLWTGPRDGNSCLSPRLTESGEARPALGIKAVGGCAQAVMALLVEVTVYDGGGGTVVKVTRVMKEVVM